MKTYKETIDNILTTAAKHKMVQSTGFGATKEIDLDKQEGQPLVWLQPTPCALNRVTGNGGYTVEYTFDLIVADRLTKDDSNRKARFSDTLRIIIDLILKLEQDVNVSLNTNPSPFMDSYDSELVGWVTTLRVTEHITIDTCELPFNN
jgi:hypothetical protein